MAIMEFVPKLPYEYAKLVPSSLLAVVVAVALEQIIRAAGFRTDTIGDIAEFSRESRFPIPFFMDDHYDMSVLRKPGAAMVIVEQAIMLCLVGVVESLLTTEVVTEIVKTPADQNGELYRPTACTHTRTRLTYRTCAHTHSRYPRHNLI
jgi:SulP family sulfate permease